MDYQEKRVLVIGMARSGVSCASLLSSLGARVTVSDQKTMDQLKDALAPLQGSSVRFALGCSDPVALLDDCDVLVVSPGVPYKAPVIQKALEKKIPVLGEMEVGASLMPGKLCAVTGTNGKTTTTTLIGEIAKNAGFVSHVVGNIGLPVTAEVPGATSSDFTVVEVSSFQLETIDTFHPQVSAVLNITEDHLNRHGTMQEYIRLKRRIMENQTSRDAVVLNREDPIVWAMAEKAPCRVFGFSDQRELERGAFLRDGQIVFRDENGEKMICAASEVYIPGPHNLQNALAAACVCCLMGIPAPVVRHTLRTFKGVEHRIEFVRELNGVQYINDSKGTNVDSTIKAVQTMKRPTVILLGGFDKHTDFAPLAREMKASAFMKAAIVLGDTARQIDDTLRSVGFTPVSFAPDFESAVKMAKDIAVPGDAVLLSPACASFDMFSDYEERGRVFKRIVHSL